MGKEDLLLEVGCEELPSRFIPGALAQLEEGAVLLLKEHRLSFEGSKSWATPRRLVLLISGLAAHTRHIGSRPKVSLLIVDHEPEEGPVHALSRLTILADARVVEPGEAGREALQQRYLQRFPDAEPLTLLPDFRYVVLQPRAVRQVAGFGTARDVPLNQFERLLRSM